jgi:hypothetical protein
LRGSARKGAPHFYLHIETIMTGTSERFTALANHDPAQRDTTTLGNN